MATTFSRFVRLNTSASASSFTGPPSANVRLRRRFTVRKSGPVPEFLGMNSPSTIGRPAVPWIVVTPEVMLSGSLE